MNNGNCGFSDGNNMSNNNKMESEHGGLRE